MIYLKIHLAVVLFATIVVWCVGNENSQKLAKIGILNWIIANQFLIAVPISIIVFFFRN